MGIHLVQKGIDMKNEFEEIIMQDIKVAYGSLEEPNFIFKQRNYSSRPYNNIVSKLSSEFEVEEDTDLNADVSQQLTVKHKDGSCAVELSLVGRYAVLLRVFDGCTPMVLTDQNSNEYERKIIDIVEKNDVKILPQEVLEEKIELRLFYTERDRVCVYQALFSDTDFLPWQD